MSRADIRIILCCILTEPCKLIGFHLYLDRETGQERLYPDTWLACRASLNIDIEVCIADKVPQVWSRYRESRKTGEWTRLIYVLSMK